jgi:hypothetical protein
MAHRSDGRRSIALVTYDARPGVTDDDHLLADALSARGSVVHAVPWSDPAAPWNAYDAVVVRSCWDYFLRTGEFHMKTIRGASLAAHAAAKEAGEGSPARSAAHAAGQAVATAHVPTHALGPAIYALQAISRAACPAEMEAALDAERAWQYRRLLELRESDAR